MKVLMTADAVGGVWTYALDLAAELDAQGIDVVLATMGPRPSDAQCREAAALPNLQLQTSEWALEWAPDPWADVDRAADWLLGLEAEAQPHIIHLNGYAHGACAFAAPKLVVAHSCVFTWWQAVHGTAPPDSWNTYRQRVQAGLRRADAIVAPTQAMLDALQQTYDVGHAGTVIPNGRMVAGSTGQSKEPLIFSAGRLWDEAKNVQTLAAAAEGLPWKTVVAGAGSGDLPGVEWLGHVDPETINTWLGKASLYCLPARYEPFGLSALEAALHGCALVLGDIKTLREVWGDAAVYVAPNDAAALRRVLQQLIDDPEHRTDLARKAKLRAARYSRARMGDAYAACYHALLAQRTQTRQEGPQTPCI